MSAELGPVGDTIKSFIQSQMRLFLRTFQESETDLRYGVTFSRDLGTFTSPDRQSGFITSATTAPHKQMHLVKAAEADGRGYGVYGPGEKFGGKELGPLYPHEVSLDKLKQAIGVLPDTELGLVTAADLAVVIMIGDRPVADMGKAGNNTPEKFIVNLFQKGEKGKSWRPMRERIDASAAWGHKVKNYRGRDRDVWRYLTTYARMWVEFNAPLVQLLSRENVAQSFHRFVREKRKQIVKVVEGDLKKIPSENIASIIGPEIADVADTMPKEYLYWFLESMFVLAEDGKPTKRVKAIELGHEDYAILEGVELTLRFPKEAQCEPANTEIKISPNSFSELPWDKIIYSTMEHIYNYPPYLVSAAINYFENLTKNGQGIGQPAKRSFKPSGER